ncbi:MAG TPA: lipopolysaccharide biosynthesis protein [Reyranellaceae bacterium]|nr:lipopolysaccharide biosynthesis protein [Reyranellaceae bacterium]
MSRASGAPSPDAHLATGHLLEGIGERTRRGGALLLAMQAVKVALQLAALAVLARLLPPAAFGLLAMVAALGAMLEFVKEFGLSSATIQRHEITQRQVSALFWINAGLGIGIAAALALAAPLVAAFYGQPQLEGVTRWLALGFALSGLSVQHWALLRRQMRFGAIAGIELAAEFAALGTAVALALGGADYWALVAQRLVSPALQLGLSWIVCRWRPDWPHRTTGVASLVRYGASVTGSGLAVALSRSVDQILLGWLFGPAALGLYERAARLLMLPINTINAPVYAAGMPALSRLADQPARYRAMFRQVVQKLALLTMPTFALAAIMADWVVAVLFGPAWREAAPIVFFFAIAAMHVPTVMAVGLLYMTQDRTGEMLRATLIDCALCLASILAGLPFGAVGVAAALALTGLFVRLPISFTLAARHGPVAPGAIYEALAIPVITTAVAALTAAGLRLADVGLIGVGMGGVFAAALVVLAFAETRRDVLRLMPRRLRFPLRLRRHRPAAHPS